MNRETRHIYAKEKQTALMFIYNADTDYVAARCCILNGLFSGFALASQAVEKILKAYIYLETNQKKTNEHNPFKLKEELKKKTNRKYEFDKYDDLLKKLFDYFQMRYFDNARLYETNGAGGEELKRIDELYLELYEKLPLPDEVKYRTKFFSDLCEDDLFRNNQFWLKKNNPAVAPKFDIFEIKYKEMIYPEK